MELLTKFKIVSGEYIGTLGTIYEHFKEEEKSFDAIYL
jgi:hypothetical protein